LQVLSALRHPHVVPYVEYFWEDDDWDNTLCLVMAYCEGGDLCAEIIKRRKEKRPFTEDEVWTYFVQVLLALQYMHAKRILHRDIKVHNVFLCDGKAMLADFGVSKCLEDSHDMAKTQVGKIPPPTFPKPNQTKPNQTKPRDPNPETHTQRPKPFSVVRGSALGPW
jgi:NIMA (never in mitosis gene a)-related kinase